MNIAGTDARGVMLSGLGSVAGTELTGIAVSGGMNIAGSDMRGLVVSGIVGTAGGSMSGVAVSGLGNISGERASGIRVTGIVNVAGSDASGLSIAGLANVTGGTAQGLQIGVVNVASWMTGLPVGLYTRVSDVPQHLSVIGDETGFAMLELRSGSESWNNFVTVGFRGVGSPSAWATGAGIGRRLRGLESPFVDIDALAYFINEDELWSNDLHMLVKGRVKAGVHIASGLVLFAGGSYNLLISQLNDGSDLAPWIHGRRREGDTYLTTWPGVFAGIGIEWRSSSWSDQT